MPCYHPLKAWKLPSSMVGPMFDSRIKFHPMPGYEEIELPCGRCVGCRLERSRQWAIRCLHESSLHRDNCFLTLTYSPENIPRDGSVSVREIQLFMKKLRAFLSPKKVRFLACGEYGSQLDRPHYHLLIFGYDFPDCELFFVSKAGEKVYRSPELEKLWTKGFSTVGDVTFESAAYVCRYVLKKVNGDIAESHYGGRQPEFLLMSRRPGIGGDWIKKYSTDVYPKDYLTIRNGVKCHPPRYYDRMYELNHGDGALSVIKDKRKEYAAKNKRSESRLLNMENWQKNVASRLKRELKHI